jgi:DMSO/TMAO reductase YedYZ molybdopterin-dependent catalytic subunit
MGNYYFIVRGDDDFRVVIAMAEVAPRFTDKKVILAYEQDGEEIRTGLRLVVPGDDLAGRSIFGVAGIELRQAESNQPQPSRPISESLSLLGSVERPEVFTTQTFDRLPSTEAETLPTPRHGGVTVAPRRYEGVAVWDLLDSAGIVLNPEIHEDLLRRVVVARSTDGCAAVIAGGEFDPRFMAGNVIVATRIEGEPLPADGGSFRLVVPYDKAIGRALKSVTSLELRDG